MRIFPPIIEVGETEGFSATHDLFGRASLGNGLTNLVSSVSESMVVAVDGKWGSGKTTFLKMWAGELRKAGFPVVYFDAFENDYAEDAFTVIAGEVIALSRERKKGSSPAAKKLLSKAIGTGKILLRGGLKLGVKATTMGAMELADLESLAGEASKEASELFDKYLGELLTKQKQQKDTIQGFRDALAELPALLTESPAEPKPLIFIVDELDRCRPLFALEVIERIKHFFSVPNVHFVLGTHLGQLRNSVVVAYGPEIDARTYLEKFIHITLTLIDNQEHVHTRVITKYLNYLATVLEFKPEDGQTVRQCMEFIRQVAEVRDLSLRTIERIMTNLALALAFGPPGGLRPGPILSGLCVLKVIAPDLYTKAKQGRLTFADVKDTLCLGEKKSDNPNVLRDMEHARKWWRFCTDETAEPELISQLAEAAWRYRDSNRFGIVPAVANDTIDRLIAG